MYNYNVINPVNIHYRKYSKDENTNLSPEKKTPSATDEKENGGRRFPNGNKVAIDYTKNSINISQVLQDFRSTVAAINSPDDVKEEVESYLGLITRETDKSSPSREIVLANLKNAARVTDKYIQDSLKKPSRVVEDWVDALFLQSINLKPDPTDINEEFKVKIPERQAQTTNINSNFEAHTPSGITPLKEDKVEFSAPKIEPKIDKTYIESTYTTPAESVKADEPSEIKDDGNIFIVDNKPYFTETKDAVIEEKPETEEIIEQVEPKTAPEAQLSPFAPRTEKEVLAKNALMSAKDSFENGADMYSTLKLYDDALEYIGGSSNVNLKSAIYFERGKVFDSYNYAELALIDFNKATKSTDGNLKTQAHIKMGNIYDDYVQIEPAIVQYTKAIETSEETNNLYAKTRALRYMASMFTKMYDKENTETFTDLALESANETGNKKTITTTYLEAAKNYSYIGEDSKALEIYSKLAQNDKLKDDYATMAKNYMEASILMESKGNKRKAYALLLKSKEYARLSRLSSNAA